MPQIDHIVLAVRDLEAAADSFRAAGFTVTPKAEHPWGTANRRVQFRGRNFIEILTVDRPELLFEHDLESDPRQFSFGAFTRDYLAQGEGMSMFVIAGTDAQRDVERFQRAGLSTYAPFDFERASELPDGSVIRLGFSLAFATPENSPRTSFFTCVNRNPDVFWKPEFEAHANGTDGITEAVLVAEDPSRLTGFTSGYADADARTVDGGLSVPCGPHTLSVLTPDAFQLRFPGAEVDLSEGPKFGAIMIAGASEAKSLDINGMRLELVA